MNLPTLLGAREVAADTICLSSYFPLADLGVLPVNAFVIRAAQPVLVDTGLSALRLPFLDALREVVDLGALRWIWLSHIDADHVGNLDTILALAPRARVVTSFLGLGKMRQRLFDVSRVHLLQPGGSIDAGDRKLVAVRPPYYDAPETKGFFDTATRVLFSADAFGAVLPEPQEEAAAIAPDVLRHGMTTWSAIDAPWLGMVDRAAFGRGLAGIARLDPAAIISAHLPVARGITQTMLGVIEGALTAGRYAAADRDAIERLMAAPEAIAA